jgi:hypothetical protein
MEHLLKMKRILLPALLIGLLTACADDSAPNRLYGKWQPLKAEMYADDDLQDTQAFVPANNSCPAYVEFMSDVKFRSVDPDANCKTEEIVGAYTFDGSNLKMTVEGEDQNYKLVSMTPTEFVMEESFTIGGVTYKDKIFLKRMK